MILFFIRKILITTIACYLFLSPHEYKASASENNIVSLDKLMKESDMNDDNVVLYVLKRCSGLALNLYALMNTQPENEKKKYYDMYEMFITRSLELSNIIFGNTNGNDVKRMDALIEDVQKIAVLYGDEMNEHYLRTGSRASEVSLGDMKICAFIHNRQK